MISSGRSGYTVREFLGELAFVVLLLVLAVGVPALVAVELLAAAVEGH